MERNHSTAEPRAARSPWLGMPKINDVGASLVVFLVAVPLAMGIALASGAPIMSGLIASIVGGVVVGVLSGAPLQVSGPAAGLSVVVFGLVQKYGFPAVCAMAMAAGVIQMLMGALRVARLALAIAPAVIHGMLAGIGVLIALAQVHVVLGFSPQSSAFKNVVTLPEQLRHVHLSALGFGLLTMAILIVWPRLPWARVRAIPGALVAVSVATVASLWSELPRVSLPGGLNLSLHLPVWPGAELGAALVASVSLALIASAESLLCAVATDKLHTGPRADLDRELIAQGAGNLLSGLLGGLPITGVIVRTKANVDTGAKTRWSAVMHGLWILLFVAQLGFVLTRIPLAVLAGLLVVVGVRLVNIEHVRELHRHHEARIYFITLGGVVLINLLAGIGLGIAAGLAMMLWKLARTRISLHHRDDHVILRVRGVLTFLGVPKLSQHLAQVPAQSSVVVDLSIDYIDHAGVDALQSFATSHRKSGGRVQMDLDGVHQALAQRTAAEVSHSSLPMIPLSVDMSRPGALALGPFVDHAALHAERSSHEILSHQPKLAKAE